MPPAKAPKLDSHRGAKGGAGQDSSRGTKKKKKPADVPVGLPVKPIPEESAVDETQLVQELRVKLSEKEQECKLLREQLEVWKEFEKRRGGTGELPAPLAAVVGSDKEAIGKAVREQAEVWAAFVQVQLREGRIGGAAAPTAPAAPGPAALGLGVSERVLSAPTAPEGASGEELILIAPSASPPSIERRYTPVEYP